MAQFTLLADRPDFISTIAAGTLAEYSRDTPERTFGWRVARLRRHLNRQTLPIAWVLHDGDTVLGTAALRLCDFEGYEHFTPWLSGVFVFPEARGRGFGLTLCSNIEREAIKRGVSDLYLATFAHQPWYRTMGWLIIQSDFLRGKPCVIMRKTLPSQI